MSTMITRLLAACAAALFFAAPMLSQAQSAPTLTFTAELTRALESLTPKLTWSTTPAGAACTASGDTQWTGTKPASGSETLAAINSTRTYAQDCVWPGDSQAILKWTPSATYTNGAPMTISSYNIYFSRNLTDLTAIDQLTPPTLPPGIVKRAHNFPAASSATVTGLTTAGTYHFCLKTVDPAGVESLCARDDNNQLGTKTITSGTTVRRTVTLTVDPRPGAGSALSVE